MKSNSNKSTYAVIIAAVGALAGLIIYIYTSVTGFLAPSGLNPLPVICTAAALLVMFVLVVQGSKLGGYGVDLAIVLTGVLLLVSFYQFVLGRVALAADVYFIPVNYPASEAAALHVSIVGLVFYLVGIIALIVTAFSHKTGTE